MKRSRTNLDSENWEDPNRINLAEIAAVLDKFGVRYEKDELRSQLFSKYVQLAKAESPASIERWTGYKLDEALPASGKLTVQKLKIFLAYFSKPFSAQSKRSNLVQIYNGIGKQSVNLSNLESSSLAVFSHAKKRKVPDPPVPNVRSTRSKRKSARKSVRKSAPKTTVTNAPNLTPPVPPAPTPSIRHPKRAIDDDDSFPRRSKRSRIPCPHPTENSSVASKSSGSSYFTRSANRSVAPRPPSVSVPKALCNLDQQFPPSSSVASAFKLPRSAPIEGRESESRDACKSSSPDDACSQSDVLFRWGEQQSLRPAAEPTSSPVPSKWLSPKPACSQSLELKSSPVPSDVDEFPASTPGPCPSFEPTPITGPSEIDELQASTPEPTSSPSPSESDIDELQASTPEPNGSFKPTSSPSPSNVDELKASTPGPCPSVEPTSSPGPSNVDELRSSMPGSNPSLEPTSSPGPSNVGRPQASTPGSCPSLEPPSSPSPSNEDDEFRRPQPAPWEHTEPTSSLAPSDVDVLLSSQAASSPSFETSSSVAASNDADQLLSPQSAPSEFEASASAISCPNSESTSILSVPELCSVLSESPSPAVELSHGMQANDNTCSLVEPASDKSPQTCKGGSRAQGGKKSAPVHDLVEYPPAIRVKPVTRRSARIVQSISPTTPSADISEGSGSSAKSSSNGKQFGRKVTHLTRQNTPEVECKSKRRRTNNAVTCSSPPRTRRKGQRRAQGRTKRSKKGSNVTTDQPSFVYRPPINVDSSQELNAWSPPHSLYETHPDPPILPSSDAPLSVQNRERLSPDGHCKKKRRVGKVAPQCQTKGKSRQRNQTTTSTKSRRSSRKKTQSQQRKNSNPTITSFIYRPDIDDGVLGQDYSQSAVDLPPRSHAGKVSSYAQSLPESPHPSSSIAAFPIPATSSVFSSPGNGRYFLRSSPSASSLQHQTSDHHSPTHRYLDAPGSVQNLPPVFSSRQKRRVRNGTPEYQAKGKKSKKNTTATPPKLRRSSRQKAQSRQQKNNSDFPSFVYRPPIDDGTSADDYSQNVVDSPSQFTGGQSSSYVQSLPTTPNSSNSPLTGEFTERSSSLELQNPRKQGKKSKKVCKPRVRTACKTGASQAPQKCTTAAAVIEAASSVHASSPTNQRYFLRSSPSQCASPLPSNSTGNNTGAVQSEVNVPVELQTDFAPSKRRKQSNIEGNGKRRRLNNAAAGRSQARKSNSRARRAHRRDQREDSTSPSNKFSFVYRPPLSHTPGLPQRQNIEQPTAVPHISIHSPVSPSHQPLPHYGPPNPTSSKMNPRRTCACGPRIESWRSSVPPTTPDALDRCLLSKDLGPQVLSELRRISSGIDHLQERPLVSDRREKTIQKNPRDNTLAARVRVHVATLFGKGFSAQGGRFPPAATRSERESWRTISASHDWSDDEDQSSSRSSLDLEDQDPSFPYPGGPGHSSASPETLNIMWRTMRQARISSFRPDFTKSMNHKNNKPLWNLAYDLLLTLSRAGEYDDIDLETHSEKRIYDALAVHVKYLTRSFREANRWSHTARDAVKGRKRCVTRAANRRQARVDYLMSQPILTPLIPIALQCTSDDETDEEWTEQSDDGSQKSNSKRVNVLRMPWRHPRINQMMIALDSLIARQNSTRPGGKRPVTRLRSRRAKLSTIQCPRGLPADCYEGEWLKDHHPSFVTNLSIQPGPNLRPMTKVLEKLLR